MTTSAKPAEPSIENIERILAQLESVRHLTDGPSLSQFNAASATFVDLHLFDILNRFDSRKLSKRLEEKPELFFPLINAFCNFSHLKLAREKFEWQKQQAQARQRAREEKQRARTPAAITIETLRSLKNCLQSTDEPISEPIDPAVVSNNEPSHATAAPSRLVLRPEFGVPPSGGFSPTEARNPQPTAEAVDDICPSATLSSRAARPSLHRAVCGKRTRRGSWAPPPEERNPARSQYESADQRSTSAETEELLLSGSPS
jgi:hypothetical protein